VREAAKKAFEMSQNTKKVLIVDEHLVVIEGVRAAVTAYPEFEVVGHATDGAKAVELVKSLDPDIVILDISMPNMGGVKATEEIKKISDKTSVVIFSMHGEREYVVSLLKAGISAYVLKESPVSELITALKAVSLGGTYLCATAQEVVLNHIQGLEEERAKGDPIEKLSVREQEVFRLLADGQSVKQIADSLCISTKTVESHKYNILAKLNVQTMAELTKIAFRKGLIKI